MAWWVKKSSCCPLPLICLRCIGLLIFYLSIIGIAPIHLHVLVQIKAARQKLENWKTYFRNVSLQNNNKTGVINDPLGQPAVPAGSDCRLILKFWDGRTDGRTLCVKIVITTGRDCGRPRGSIFGLKRYFWIFQA